VSQKDCKMSRTVKKAYRKSKRFDKSCRSNGGCSYCEGNRLYKHRKNNEKSLYGLKNLYDR
jgi:hypothetical protein